MFGLRLMKTKGISMADRVTAERVCGYWTTLRRAAWGEETHKSFRLQVENLCAGLSLSRDGDVGIFVESHRDKVRGTFNYLTTVVNPKPGAPDRSFIYLELKDPELENTFASFCEYVLTAAKALTQPVDGANFLEENLETWRRLLKARRGKFSDEEVRGLWCELDVLEDLLKTRGLEAVRAWTGPGDKFGGEADRTHDFSLAEGLVEVKSLYRHAGRVHVASLDQLDVPEGEKLQLLVVTLADDVLGVSLREKVKGVRRQIQAFCEASNDSLEEFDKKMEGLGWDEKDPSENLDHRYSRTSIKGYDADRSDFPSLRRSRIDPSILKADYDLSVTALEPFEEPAFV